MKSSDEKSPSAALYLGIARYSKAQELAQGRDDLALHEEFERVGPAIGAGRPMNVLGGIEPDLGRHQLQQADRRRPEPDGLALQVGDVANPLAGE